MKLLPLWIVLGFFGLVGLVSVSSYITYANMGATSEIQIKAQYTNMENVLSGYSLKVVEAAQVPAMYKNGVVEVAKAAIQGRYGDKGSQATFQWIKEQNPTLDPALYTKIEQIIEGGRDNFQVEQTKFIDTERSYQTQLNLVWSGFWLHRAGYPKIDFDKYKIITSEHANEAFSTGVDKGIKLPQ